MCALNPPAADAGSPFIKGGLGRISTGKSRHDSLGKPYIFRSNGVSALLDNR